MHKLKILIIDLNHVIDLLLIAANRPYYLEQTERIKEKRGKLNHYGFVMNILISKYNGLYSSIESEVKKHSFEELEGSELWNDLSHFYYKNVEDDPYVKAFKKQKYLGFY